MGIITPANLDLKRLNTSIKYSVHVFHIIFDVSLGILFFMNKWRKFQIRQLNILKMIVLYVLSSGDLEPNLNQNGRRSEWLRSSTFHNETKTVRVEFCNFRS